jgi:transcriptional regulator with XRE-family HTH domain
MDPEQETETARAPAATNAETFAERLALAVGGRSVREYARAIGLSESVVRQYLKGKSEPTRPALVAMARAGGVSLEWLASGSGPMRAGGPEPRAAEAHPAEEIDFLERQIAHYRTYSARLERQVDALQRHVEALLAQLRVRGLAEEAREAASVNEPSAPPPPPAPKRP